MIQFPSVSFLTELLLVHHNPFFLCKFFYYAVVFLP